MLHGAHCCQINHQAFLLGVLPKGRPNTYVSSGELINMTSTEDKEKC